MFLRRDICEVRAIELTTPKSFLGVVISAFVKDCVIYAVYYDGKRAACFDTREEAFRFRRLLMTGKLVAEGVNHKEAVNRVYTQIKKENN